MNELIMAKYGEIALKGLNKGTFEDILVKNIRRRLRHCGKFHYMRKQSTIYIEPVGECDLDEVIEKLKVIFGIGALQRCAVFEKDFEQIKSQGVPYLENALKNAKTFKVDAKRSDKSFPMKTPEIQAELGGAILEAYPHLSVDVHNPEITVMCEIRDKGAYVSAERIIGAGGMPVGSSGKALLLLSGGIDSPVAGHMISKRGVEIDAVNFFSFPYTSERAKEKVIELASIIAQYTSKINLYIVPFTEIQLQIAEKCPEEHLTLVMRRFMMRIAERLARKHKSLALVTGESVGQVASQTLAALDVTNSAVDMPVLQPLIGMDKIEIVDRAHEIGTFETSILPYEDCCTVFTPKHPTTNPKRANIEKSENRLDVETLIEAALAGVEKIEVYPK